MAVYINGKTMSMTSGVPVVVEGLTEVNTGTPSNIRGIVKGNGSDLQTATPGVDYQTPLTPNVDYQTPLVSGTDYQTPIKINGLLKGNGTTISAATAGTDYLVPPTIRTSLPSSGTALTANSIYNVSSNVGTYKFRPPANGAWAHGKFKVATTFNITFYTGSTFIGAAPSIEAGKTYEFDVYNNIWAIQEVVSG